VGTGNKTERMLGYFTWHADDTPPVKPLGRPVQDPSLGPRPVSGRSEKSWSTKHPAPIWKADQTDEGDLGITYARADALLAKLLLGYSDAQLVEHGFSPDEVSLVRGRVDATHWKRHLPTTAMLTNTAINEFYLRPVDY